MPHRIKLWVILPEGKREVMVSASTEVCKPQEGHVYPGTWPDCPDCHGTGHVSKGKPNAPCPTCQERSEAISHGLKSEIEFDYTGRPRNYVPNFPHPDEVYPPAWIPITWAELWHGAGVNLGTWPDCPECRGLGIQRYEISWDGHRSDYEWQSCRDCQYRTRMFHAEHPDEKDLLLRKHKAEQNEAYARYQAELKEMEKRHQAELDALPY